MILSRHFIQLLKEYNIDIMLEIKDKERSALKAITIIKKDKQLYKVNLMAPTDPKKILKNLLESQQLAVLATQSQNIPYANLIAFISIAKYKKLLFGTNRNTTKYENLKKNKNISMLFDNRKNYISDFSQAITVTAIGTAHEVEKQKYQNLFLSKHPQLETFIKKKDCALIMIKVDKYIIVEKFQEITILKP